MKIEKFVTGIISTNCYIVTNEETKETVIVDPANLSKAMIGYIEEEELVIKAILLTHAHFDQEVYKRQIVEIHLSKHGRSCKDQFDLCKITRLT